MSDAAILRKPHFNSPQKTLIESVNALRDMVERFATSTAVADVDRAMNRAEFSARSGLSMHWLEENGLRVPGAYRKNKKDIAYHWPTYRDHVLKGWRMER